MIRDDDGNHVSVVHAITQAASLSSQEEGGDEDASELRRRGFVPEYLCEYVVENSLGEQITIEEPVVNMYEWILLHDIFTRLGSSCFRMKAPLSANWSS